jgi:hypothetical protein
VIECQLVLDRQLVLRAATSGTDASTVRMAAFAQP